MAPAGMGDRCASAARGCGSAIVPRHGGLARVSSGGTGVVHGKGSCNRDGHTQRSGPEDGVLSAQGECDRVDRQARAGQSVSCPDLTPICGNRADSSSRIDALTQLLDGSLHVFDALYRDGRTVACRVISRLEH